MVDAGQLLETKITEICEALPAAATTGWVLAKLAQVLSNPSPEEIEDGVIDPPTAFAPPESSSGTTIVHKLLVDVRVRFG